MKKLSLIIIIIFCSIVTKSQCSIQVFPQDTTICRGDSVQMQALVSGTGIAYNWSPAIGLSSSLIENPTVKPLVSTKYIVRAVNSLGCEATDSIYIVVELCGTLPAIFQSCPNSDTMLISNKEGSTYQWQLNTGNGFTNINDNGNYSGTQTDTIHFITIPSSWYGYQYQCVVDNISTSTAYSIQFINTWTGADNTSVWEDPNNWSCSSVPDNNTDVVINNGNVVLSSNVSVRSLTVSPNANFTVASGYNITISH
jgi:hypothetical protein